MTVRAEVLVVGVGGAGASALCALAGRGVTAIGIDRFDPGHDRGSSHGETRIIRRAYFEHPDYVPLVDRAFEGWRSLETETGEHLLEECGLVLIGPAHPAVPSGDSGGGPGVIAGVDLAADRYDIEIERWDHASASERLPWLRVPGGHEIRWEPAAGFLRVEACVRAHARLAVERGAVLRTGEQVMGWDADGAGVTVRTDRDTYEADRLVLCPGAWSTGLLGRLAPAVGLHVLRKVLLWMPANGRAPLPDTVFYVDTAEGGFYGFPSLDGATVKIAEHTGGAAVDSPATVDRSQRDSDVVGAAQFVRTTLPGLTARPVRHAVCMYTMTSDGHFVIDRHPEHPQVVVAAGFSGHGYKFMSALGPALADLAVDGRTDAPIDFLGLGRFDRTDGTDRTR